MAFDILAAVLSSGWGCANLETEAWKGLTCSAEEREGGWEARRRGEKEGTGAAGLRWERPGRGQTGGQIPKVWRNVASASPSRILLLLLFSLSVASALLWPPDSSPPASWVRGILQARMLEGLPFPSPGDLSYPGSEPSSAVAGGFFATEPPGRQISKATAWEVPWHQRVRSTHLCAPWLSRPSLTGAPAPPDHPSRCLPAPGAGAGQTAELPGEWGAGR